MMRHIGIYVRVSSRKQDHRSQKPDLKRWVGAFADGQQVKWYRDKATGKTMERPGWKRLESNMRDGKVSRIVVWRLDRLGRTASGLTALFDDLRNRKVGLVSIKDSLDLQTAAGRLMANVLASVAAYETEVRAERVVAGQAAARATGKRWGGSQSGRRTRKIQDKAQLVRRLHHDGDPVAQIARTLSMSRTTIYSVLSESNGGEAG